MHLRGLVPWICFFHGTAGDGLHIHESHHGAQQQLNTLTKAFAGSVEAREALVPSVLVNPMLAAGRARARRPFRKRRARVDLHAFGGPEEYQLLPKDPAAGVNMLQQASMHLLSKSESVAEGPWQAYLQLLDIAPLPTKAVTAAFIIGAADAVAQVVESSLAASKNATSEGNLTVDFARVARWSFFGFFLQAPWNHFFYLALDGAIPPTEDPFTSTTAIKVFIDQFLQAPVFTAVIFLFFALAEGRGLAAGKQQVADELFQVLLKNWAVFLPATFINLGFLPSQLRVLFLNSVFFFWTIYLSLTVNAPQGETGAVDK